MMAVVGVAVDRVAVLHRHAGSGEHISAAVVAAGLPVEQRSVAGRRRHQPVAGMGVRQAIAVGVIDDLVAALAQHHVALGIDGGVHQRLAVHRIVGTMARVLACWSTSSNLFMIKFFNP